MMYTIDTRSFKEKVDYKLWEAKRKAEAAGRWIIQNPMETVALAGAGVAVVKTGMNVVTKVHVMITDKTARSMVYCNDIQNYVHLKHELTSGEAMLLRQRMNAGQTKLQALMEMGLLK